MIFADSDSAPGVTGMRRSLVPLTPPPPPTIPPRPRPPGIIQGVREIYRTEGLTRGVFRGWGIAHGPHPPPDPSPQPHPGPTHHASPFLHSSRPTVGKRPTFPIYSDVGTLASPLLIPRIPGFSRTCRICFRALSRAFARIRLDG